MYGDLRVVSTCLDAQIAVGFQRVELVGGEVWEALQGGGLQVAEPESILALLAKQCRTKTEGDGQPCGRQADGLAGVVGGSPVRAGRRSELPGTETLRHACGGDGPVLEELHQLRTGIGDHVKCGEVQSILHRSENARLMLPVEGIGTRSRRLRLARSCLLAPQRESTCGAGSQPGQASSRGAEQAAPRDRRPLARLGRVPCALRFQQADRERPELMSCVFLIQTTAAASFDNGSDSALTASESSLTSAFVSLS